MVRRVLLPLVACLALAAPAAAQSPPAQTTTDPATGIVTATDPTTGVVTVTDPKSGTVVVSDPRTGQVTTTPGTGPVAGTQAGEPTKRAPLILLAAVGALLLAVGVAWAVAHWWAYEPPWVLRTRHATAEAGWRTSAAWAEFCDWLRLGR